MALTAEQLVILRGELGDAEPPTDAELEALYEIRGGLVGVVRHVWSQRLAALLAEPAAFTVVGDYSQSVSANIQTIRDRLVELASHPDDSDDVPQGGLTVFKVFHLVRDGQDR